MESRIEKAQNFLDEGVLDLPTAEDFEDARMAVEADMLAGIEESQRLGWMSQEEGDSLIREWRARYS